MYSENAEEALIRRMLSKFRNWTTQLSSGCGLSLLYISRCSHDEQFQIADHGRRSCAETQHCAGGGFCVLQSGDRHRLHDHQSCGIRCGGTDCLQTLRPPLLRYPHRVSNQPHRAARCGGTLPFPLRPYRLGGHGHRPAAAAALRTGSHRGGHGGEKRSWGAKTPRSCTSAARRKNA